MLHTGLFDMDGTMFDTERLSLLGWRDAAKKTGIPLTDEMILSFRGRNKKMNEEMFHSWFGEDAPYKEVRKYRDEWILRYLDEKGLPEKKGLRELLDYLKSLGWKLCIVTGTAREDASKYWNRTGILEYFDDTLCGDEVTVCKPDPEIFRKAAAKMGAKPEECMVFEDSPNGIRSASAAGCHSILIYDLDRAGEEIARLSDFACDSLLEARDYLKENL